MAGAQPCLVSVGLENKLPIHIVQFSRKFYHDEDMDVSDFCMEWKTRGARDGGPRPLLQPYLLHEGEASGLKEVEAHGTLEGFRWCPSFQLR